MLHPTAYTGTCADMCPKRERETRLGFQLSIFERDYEDQPDDRLMVKEYRRAGADQEEPPPDDLRTPKALQITMNHLVFNVMDDSRSLSPDLALEWYDFLWDRLRAIRKDITQQNICDQASAILVERCIRFHVHSCYAMNHIKDFDIDMNKRNLNDCLQMLRQMYQDLKIEGITCEGELEFQKYNILLHLDEDALSTTVLMKTSAYRSSEEMKFIIKIFNAYLNNDYFKFFKLMQQADYMTSCILSLYVNKIRLKAFKIITNSCTSRQVILYPADLVIETLAFDDLNDLSNFISTFGIQLQEKNSEHHIVLKKDVIKNIDLSTLLPFKSKRLIEDKTFQKSVGQLVYGAEKRVSVPRDEEELIEVDHFVPQTTIDLDMDVDPYQENQKFPEESSDTSSDVTCSSEEPIEPIEDNQIPLEQQVVAFTEDEPEATVQNNGWQIEAAAPSVDYGLDNHFEPVEIKSYHDEIDKQEEIKSHSDETKEIEEVISPDTQISTDFCKKIMPAGRFRRKTFAKPPKSRQQSAPKQIPGPPKPVIRKPNQYSRKLVDMQQAIKYESKANEKLLELIKVFFQ